MSTHQESMEVSTDMEPIQEHNQHEEAEGEAMQEGNNDNNSLLLFLVAIGSAILSTLFTLLILAVVNGGTLSFTGGERLTKFQDYMEQVNGNVGTLNDKVESVKSRATELAAEMEGLQSELDNQDTEMNGLDDAVAKIDQTRQQFDGFVSALNVALSSIQSPEEETATAENSEPVVVKTQPEVPSAEESESEDNADEGSEESSDAASSDGEAAASPAPMISMSEELPANTIAALILDDLNGNGMLDGGETSVGDIMISLSLDGAVVESKATSEAGATFMDLAPGSYEITVDDMAEYTLLTADTTQVDLGEGNESGQFVYFTIQSGE